MTLEGAKRQRDEAPTAGGGDERRGTSRLMEAVVERDTRTAAVARVRQNQGSPGIDGMTTEELAPYVREHWPRRREELLTGTYQPQPVKRGRDSSERRRGSPTRDSDRARPFSAASGFASPAAALRPNILCAQLRVSSRPQRPASDWRKRRWRRAAATWWTWTWKNSSTAEITTC